MRTEPVKKPARLTENQLRVLVDIALGRAHHPRRRRPQLRILWTLESSVLTKRAGEPPLVRFDRESCRRVATDAGLARLAALGVRAERVALGMLEYADPDDTSLTAYAKGLIDQQVSAGRWEMATRERDGSRYFRVTDEGRAYWQGLWR